MFRIHFTNHGYWSCREFNSFAEAAAFARSTTFDCTIHKGDEMAASYTYFGGFRTFGNREYDEAPRTGHRS
jgi:hypothetical protein